MKKNYIYILTAFLIFIFLLFDTAKSQTADDALDISGFKFIKTINANDNLERIKEIKKEKYKIAIIIDDFGNDISTAEKFIDSKINYTVSIIPFLKYSTICAEYAKKTGKEIMLHLPMEPENNKRVEQEMITVNMNKNNLERFINASLKNIPGSKGVNNHMGSKATKNYGTMYQALEFLSKKNLYFVDSLTAFNSSCENVSKNLKIKFAKRDIFLDNFDSLPYIQNRLNELISTAKNNSTAIGIGHARLNTFTAIENFRSTFEEENIEIVFVKDILK